MRLPLPVPLLCAAILAAALCAGRAVASEPGVLVVPGRLSELADAVGIDHPLPRARVLLEVIRITYAQPHDPARPAPDSPYARLTGYLARQSSPGGSPPGGGSAGAPDLVPLPIPTDAWQAVLGRKVRDEDLCSAILLDRRAALLYYGLAALDEPTRAEFVRNRALLARIYAERAGTFATLGRGLRVEGGQVATPGGPEAASLWTHLAGEAPSRPAAFVERLFWKDEGRLAYFYDTLAHLDAPRLAFAMGAGERDANARMAQFERLYRSFSPTLRSWQPELRPFYRTTADAADLLFRVRARPDGRLAPPAWRGLWETAFESADLSPEAVRAAWRADALDPMSAARLVELVCVPEVNVRFDRFRTVLLAQHAFADATPASGPDIITAVRGAPPFWSLVLTLDRMGIVDPAVYAMGVRRAASFNTIEDAARRAVAISQFQGALALLERARFARTLDASTATKLASSLVLVPLTSGRYAGSIAQWLDTSALPLLQERTGAGKDSVIAAIAGRRAGRRPSPKVAWEGADYRVDVAEAESRRLSKIAESQLPQPIEVVLAFSRAARHAATLQHPADLVSFLPGLLKVSAQFQAPQAIGLGAGSPLASPTAVVKSVLSEANDVTRARPGYYPPPVVQIALPLLDEADALVAELLAALAYIPALGDPERGALLLGRVSLQHDLLLASRDARETQARGPWLIPEEVTAPGERWHIKGSLLGIDLALARLTLREIVAEQLPPPPSLAVNDSRTFAETVALSNPFAVTDEGRDRIVAALADGRNRLKAAAADAQAAAGLAAVAAAGGWRIEAVRWSATHAPEEVEEFFSLSDLLRIGGYEDREGELNAWGASGLAWNGLAFAQFPDAGAWETYAGRLGTALLAGRLPDLTLKAAEALAERHLPASLLRGVLAAEMQDFLDEVRLAHPEDWLSAARCAANLRDTRFDDYVAALTWNGPLIPESR